MIMDNMQIGTISGSIYKVYDTTSQEYIENRMPRLGQTVEFEDGRKFVFVSTAVNLTAGQVVASALSVNGTASANSAIGALTVSLTLAATTLDQYAGGYLTDVAGTYYRIKSNTATTSGVVVFTLFDRLQDAIATNDVIKVATYRPALVVVGTATNDSLGVVLRPSTAATTGYTNFLWAQTRGPGAVKITTGATAINNVPLMADAAGALVIHTGAKKVFATANATTAVSDGTVCNAILCFDN
jgi:hypothetical protein